MRSKKIMYNIVTNLILELIVVLYGFIIPKIIINTFGSDVNGLISSITQFLAYIALLESGFGPVVKSALYKPIANKDTKTIENILKSAEKFFRHIAIIFLIYILVLCFVYPLLVDNSFGWIYTVSLIIVISISTFAEYFFGMTYKLYLQAKQNMYIISIIQIVTYIISIFIIILMVKLGLNIQMIKLVSGLIFIMRPLVLNFYVKHKYNITLKNADNNYKLEQKWDGLAQHIAAVIHGNTDITVLSFFVSLAEISVYSVYYLVVKGIKSIVQTFVKGIDASFGDMIAKEEIENLNLKFNIYEVFYFTIITIIFTCTLLLITPFITVYTKNITDANYIRYLFGYLIVISEYIWVIRLPYSSIILAAGHFKETRIGAWVEAFVNIIISIILTSKFGLEGVIIGTIIAMAIRTMEFVYHTNKYILKRNIFFTLKKIFVLIIETLLIVILVNNITLLEYNSYISWSINAFIIFLISSIIVCTINFILNKEYTKYIFKIFKKVIKRN